MPPSPALLASALDNWEKYLHWEEKDRLVQLAVAKAQFEIIHPFLDGNGRIGRMLIPPFLFEKGLLSSPMFYLSSYLEAEREIYYQRLRAISQASDWNGWIHFFLTAIRQQAQANTEKAAKILGLYEQMKHDIPQTIRSQYVIQSIDALFDRPIFRSSEFTDRSGIPRDSAIRIINALKKNNIVEELRPGRGRRPAVMIFRQLIEIAEGER